MRTKTIWKSENPFYDEEYEFFLDDTFNEFVGKFNGHCLAPEVPVNKGTFFRDLPRDLVKVEREKKK